MASALGVLNNRVKKETHVLASLWSVVYRRTGLEGVFQRERQTIRMGGDEIQELFFRAELTDRCIVEIAVLHHTILNVVDVRDSTENDGARFGDFRLVIDDSSLDFGGERSLDFESGEIPRCGDVVHFHSFTRCVNIFEVIVEVRGNLQRLTILLEGVLHLVLDGDFFVAASTASAIIVAVLTVTGHGYQTAQAYRHQDKQVSFHIHLF